MQVDKPTLVAIILMMVFLFLAGMHNVDNTINHYSHMMSANNIDDSQHQDCGLLYCLEYPKVYIYGFTAALFTFMSMTILTINMMFQGKKKKP